jgi:hypothetical protein
MGFVPLSAFEMEPNSVPEIDKTAIKKLLAERGVKEEVEVEEYYMTSGGDYYVTVTADGVEQTHLFSPQSILRKQIELGIFPEL